MKKDIQFVIRLSSIFIRIPFSDENEQIKNHLISTVSHDQAINNPIMRTQLPYK
jgi:hypothetical protein